MLVYGDDHRVDLMVTLDDLGDYMDYNFDPTVVAGEEDERYARTARRKRKAAERVLRTLDRELEAHLRRPPKVREYNEVLTVPEPPWVPGLDNPYRTGVREAHREYQVLRLKKTPVHSVTQFTVTRRSPGSGAASGSSTPITPTEVNDYTVLPFGIELYTIYPYDHVDIKYRAGMEDAEAQELFEGMILRAAAREVQNVADETVGVTDTEPRKVAPLTVGFTARELATIAELRRLRA